MGQARGASSARASLRSDLRLLVHHHFSDRHVRMLLLGLFNGLSQSLVMVDLGVPGDDNSFLNARLGYTAFHRLSDLGGGGGADGLGGDGLSAQ